tara:strand:- start:183 stop:899 length:717 start_codon:yes stop_codon:yes gene_type:complete
MINIEEIYHEYLLSEGDKHKQKYEKYKGWFSASSAGSCHRKQWFKINDAPEVEQQVKPLRVMRLGTIVHKDIEQALNLYADKHRLEYDLYTEHRIELPKIKVVGHLDIAINDDKVYVYDLKTAHSFKWKKVFGRNVDPSPSVNYQLQLGTYGLGMINQLDRRDADIELGLIWYKKDDSMMKVQLIDSEWVDRAFFYWVELNEALEDDNVPNVGDYNTPVYNWECKYCPYHKIHCKGVI